MRPVDFTAPEPLGYAKAMQQALELRREYPCMSYPALAFVFARYHGIQQPPSWWRKHLLLAGAEKKCRTKATA